VILAVPMAIGILLAALSGGRVSRLGDAISIRYLIVIAAGFFLQLAAMTWAADGTVDGLGYRVILMAGFGVTATGFWQLRRLPFMAIPLLGLGLNLAVMVANGGTMVLTPEAAAADGFAVVAPRGETRLWGGQDVLRPWDQTALPFLSDWINIRAGEGYVRILSPGDVVLAMGVGIVGFAVVKGRSLDPQNERKNTSSQASLVSAPEGIAEARG
jgi:hypothetical protein